MLIHCAVGAKGVVLPGRVLFFSGGSREMGVAEIAGMPLQFFTKGGVSSCHDCTFSFFFTSPQLFSFVLDTLVIGLGL